MIQVRKFGPEMKTVLPDPRVKGLSVVVVQLNADMAAQLEPSEIEHRYLGSPLILDRPNLAVMMYFEPHGEMHEHPADEPVLFMAMSGKGFVRLGGPDGEIIEMSPGEAIIWPSGVPHKVWTEEEPFQAFVFHYAKDGGQE